ncbi:hypothetical protein Lser_V15G00043 [Lactuca serriola]
MLTRASRNAYSWWWASHIRTKQSKWLDQNLQDMEEKVEYIMKIITEDGDSFRVRAEQYYQKRPEIVNFVEDTFREYRALAERYDHLSKDLQSANRTIAVIFPERVQMSIDEEDDEDFAFSVEEHEKHPTGAPLPLPTPMLEAPKLNHLPKMENAVQAVLKKKKMPRKLMSKKGLIKIGVDEKAPVKSSGLSKDEALEEIDKLQKEILGFQTEKEFVKCSYENAISKFWEIETNITEMHAKISNLQDELEVRTVIEDNDAQTLMASSALKMCGETLANLKHKQNRVEKEATVEHKRVGDIRKKFEALISSNNSNSDLKNIEQTGQQVKDKTTKIEEKQQNVENRDGNGQEGLIESQPKCNFDQKESETVEDRKSRIKEEILGKSEPVTISKVAEKIEKLVDKVIILEIDLASQTALVMRLRFENDDLHEQLQSLEHDNKNLVDDSNEMKMKIKRLEEQLEGIQSLDQKVKGQNVHLETRFDDASVNLDNASNELLIAEPDENASDDEEKKEYDKRSEVQEENDLVKKPNEDNDDFEGFVMKPNEDSHELEDSVKKKDMEMEGGKELEQEQEKEQEQEQGQGQGQEQQQGQGQGQEEEQEQSLTKRVINEEHDIVVDVNGDRMDEEDQSNLKRKFSYEIEEREKMLLEEYKSTLRNYKELKKKLTETETKNRARLFKTAVEMKMLKNSNDSKDNEIRSLHEKLKLFETNLDKNVDFEVTKAQDSVIKEVETTEIDSTDEGAHEREEFDEKKEGDQDSNGDENLETEVKKDPDLNDGVDDPNEIREVEDEIRREIDEFRKESLELWLRFSTTYHQINRFQDTTNDLLKEIQEARDAKEGKEKKHEYGLAHAISKRHYQQNSPSFASDIRPIYRHLQDMLAEVTLWLESSEILEDDLQHRLISLCEIQNELANLTNDDSKSEKKARPLNDCQAAKFQGEVLNMKQENNKVLEELRAACERVKRIHIEIEETLIKLDADLGKKKRSNSKSKVPFRSFLFGVKLRKKHRPSSLLRGMSHSLQRQYSKVQESPQKEKEEAS